jgi:NAD-dependent deacetylase
LLRKGPAVSTSGPFFVSKFYGAIRYDLAMQDPLEACLEDIRGQDAPIIALTGAGISADSGIPTFRGPQGYWRQGSRNFRPEELATHSAFTADPELVWAWYLYRLGVCRSAEPNASHHALVRLERAKPEDFLLVTQNVDGLHLRAGATPKRSYEVHGCLETRRCANVCGADNGPMPSEIGAYAKDEILRSEDRDLLHCEACGGWLRPHVLWFDESYDEENFHLESAQDAAMNCGAMIIVGSTGTTALPMRMAMQAAASGAVIIDINPDSNPFSELAARATRGYGVQAKAADVLPDIVDRLLT